MNIHEYQAKRLFAENGVPVPEGYLATTGTEAEFAMRRLGCKVAVVKAHSLRRAVPVRRRHYAHSKSDVNYWAESFSRSRLLFRSLAATHGSAYDSPTECDGMRC